MIKKGARTEDWIEDGGRCRRKYSNEEGGRRRIMLSMEVPRLGTDALVVLPKPVSEVLHTFKISTSTNTLSFISSIANELSCGISDFFSPYAMRRVI